MLPIKITDDQERIQICRSGTTSYCEIYGVSLREKRGGRRLDGWLDGWMDGWMDDRLIRR
jgi:hypothetical protein